MCVLLLSRVESLLLFAVPVAPPEVKVQAAKRVILTCNESLSLTCSTTNVNGEIKLKWIPPLGSVRPLCLFLAMCCVIVGDI